MVQLNIQRINPLRALSGGTSTDWTCHSATGHWAIAF